MASINFDPKASIIILEATLTGKGPKRKLNLVLDTGATYVLIPSFIARIMGYDPEVSTKRIPLTTVSGEETAPMVKVESISVLGKQVKNVEVICHDLPASGRVDGLLGLSFLQNFKLVLDFKKGILVLE